MSLYARLAELPLRSEGYELRGLRRPVSSAFERHTTVVRLYGGGAEGLGEDVTYDAAEQRRFQEHGRALPLVGSFSLDEFSRRLDECELFGGRPPSEESWRPYRRWAFESAALDLALRQAGVTLAARVGRAARPVRFVVSLALGRPPSARPVRRWLDLDASLRFKLDATRAWDDDLVAELAATGAIDTIDLKGAYPSGLFDPPDPALYRRVAEGFPQAWIEDPALSPECAAVLAPHRERITWDAPLHSLADIDALPFPPRTINVKPSRFGTWRALLDVYETCAARGIGMYGGGQFELGPGRGQIQYLAALFHPDAPNDVAPIEYNEPVPRGGLPASPLEPALAATGFRAGASRP